MVCDRSHLRLSWLATLAPDTDDLDAVDPCDGRGDDASKATIFALAPGPATSESTTALGPSIAFWISLSDATTMGKEVNVSHASSPPWSVTTLPNEEKESLWLPTSSFAE
jgi:hypothetical protein